jgi:NADH:ubiquinone oxidoreductase subunit 4 (subunit M)
MKILSNTNRSENPEMDELEMRWNGSLDGMRLRLVVLAQMFITISISISTHLQQQGQVRKNVGRNNFLSLPSEAICAKVNH